MSTWLALWPAILVWLLWVLPVFAWNADSFRDSDWLEPGRIMRGFLWLLVRTWPYSKLHRLRCEWQRAFPDPERCAVCRTVRPNLRHLLDHFPGEDQAWFDAQQAYDDRYWTPPSDPVEAVRWLEERSGSI